MSGDKRESPRAAIRSWLHNTNSNPLSDPTQVLLGQRDPVRKPRRHVKRNGTVEHSWSRRNKDDEDARNRILPSKDKQQTKDTDIENPPIRSYPAQSQKQSEHRPASRPSESRLAERLGLHPPFRSFRDQGNDEDLELNAMICPRKRKRSMSSTSSYLEPARVSDLADSDDHRDYSEVRKTTKLTPRPDKSGPESLSESSQASNPALALAKKLAKSYERRPRHKTRGDRYELRESRKHNQNDKEDRKGSRGKKHKKHRHKEKSGAALMHDFTAQNVSHDRLTLKPAQALGLFGKGRASSPVRRRGLPDLAFSEMNFLSSRRERPEDSVKALEIGPSNTKKRRKSTKAVETEAEISRYFTSRRTPTGDAGAFQRHAKHQETQKDSHGHDSTPPFIELPDTPFLGFGSSGGNSMSPVKIVGRLEPGRDTYQKITRSPTHSTSYFTWSQSGAPSQSSPRRGKTEIVPLISSRLSNRRNSATPAEARKSEGRISTSRSRHQSVERPGIATKTTPTRRESSRPAESKNNSDQRKCPNPSTETQVNASQTVKLGTGGGHEQPPENNITNKILKDKDFGPDEQRSTRPLSKDSALSSREEVHKPGSHVPNLQTASAPPLNGSLYCETVDPLDATLEEILQQCNCHNIGKALTEGGNGVGPDRPSHNEALPVNNTKQHPSMTFENTNNHPRLTKASNSMSPFPPIASQNDRVNAHSRACLAMEQPRTQRSVHPAPRHCVNASDRTLTRDYLSDRLPNPKRARLDSRSAWNGYDTIYERQEQMEQPSLIDDANYGVDYETAELGMLERPRSDTDLGGQSADQPEPYSYWTGDSNEDRHYDLYGRQSEIYNEDIYAVEAELQEIGGHNEYNHRDPLDETNAGFDPRRHGAFHYDDPVEDHGYYPQEQVYYDTHNQSFEQRASPPYLTEDIPTTHSPLRPSHQPYPASNGLYFEERTPGAQNTLGDPTFSGFWRPHKLY